jgi:hypothetical protein
MRVDENGVVCERLELEPASPDAPLSAQALRLVRFGEMVQRAPVRTAQRITFDKLDEENDVRDRRTHIRVARPIQPDGSRGIWDADAWLIQDPASKPPRGTLGDRWQTMSGDEIVEHILQQEAAHPPRTVALREADRAAVEGATATRRRRHLLSDAELRQVAQDYETFRGLGQRDPTVQVAKKHHASRTTASRWIRRARDLGLLPD